MRKSKLILILLVFILLCSVSMFVAYNMIHGIPSKDLSPLNLICVFWGSICSGWVFGKIMGNIINWIDEN